MLLTILLACIDVGKLESAVQTEIDDDVTDADGDGFYAIEYGGNDCDDDNVAINPEAEETWYDGIDSNCDELNDYDQDGDGFVADEYADISGLNGGDCDDENLDINPEAEDNWYDGIDSNCDGLNDYDQDGDGFVADEYAEVSGLDGEDCNDEDNSIYTGAEDTWYDGIDSNCDELNDYDQDGDGYVADEYADISGLNGGDCDDENLDINPEAEDTWYDGVDSNCDGVDDYDQDGDEFISSEWAAFSLLPTGDCNDENDSIFPGAEDAWYDDVDSNCDGLSDYDQDGDGHDSIDYGGDDCDDEDSNVSVGTTYFADSDNDGFGDPNTSISLCEIQIGYVDDNTDCDDNSNLINPDKIDTVSNEIDNNCDGIPGMDEDGDTFASTASGGSDCDDTNSDTYPGAGDLWYDGVDNDCAGNDDYDKDGDGYVSDEWAALSELPAGDCDDENEAITFNVGYEDLDEDGHGGTEATYCSNTLPSGYTSEMTDCNDGDVTVYAGAAELCDGQWNDCLAAINGLHAPESEIDNDGDGYVECDAEGQLWKGEGSVLGGNDCNDELNTVYVGSQEICDNRDNDCDGSLSYEESDYDNDGAIICDANDTSIANPNWGDSTPTVGDCAPDDPLRFEGNEEVCDGVDNDCDEIIDNNPTDAELIAYYDNDGDGYGVDSSSNPAIYHCGSIPEGYAELGDDCDDNDDTKSPEVICDGLSLECDPINEIVLPDANILNPMDINEDTRFCVGNTAVSLLSVNLISDVRLEILPYSENTTNSNSTPTINCYSTVNQLPITTDYPVINADNVDVDIFIDGIRFSNCDNEQAIDIIGTGTIEIWNSNFTNNYTTVRGGAIYAKSDDDVNFPHVIIKNSTFEDNLAEQGGAIAAEMADLSIFNSTFNANENSGQGALKGGAISIRGTNTNLPQNSKFAALHIENTDFTNNQSEEGGAISAYRTDIYIKNGHFEANTLNSSLYGLEGGAMYVKEVEAEINTSFFGMNEGGSGSAIYSKSSILNLFRNTFTGNESTGRGTVLIRRGPEQIVKNNIFTDNHSDYGAPFIFERDNYQDAYTSHTLPMFMSMENNYFFSNTGAVGAILINNAQFELRNNIVTYNGSAPIGNTVTEDYVGGVLVYNPNQGSIIDGLIIDENGVSSNATRGVGGLFIKNNLPKTENSIGLEISNTLISNNQVRTTGGNSYISGDMLCEECDIQQPGNSNAQLITWESVNSFNNTRLDPTPGSTNFIQDNKTGMPGQPNEFPISNHDVYYVDNSSTMQDQDYRLCTDPSNCTTVTSSELAENGTTTYGADPFSTSGYRSYGAFGGDLGAEWDLDNDGYEFCYSMDSNLDCTCLDSDDFDEGVNVDDEGICEE